MHNENRIIRDNIKDFRLLKEFVDRNSVVDAILNKDVVYIYYSGHIEKGNVINKGFRTIEPYALGMSTAGNIVLRAFQQAGASDSKRNATRPNDELPGWRLFYLDGITTFMKTMKKFPAKGKSLRPDYNPNDKGMTQIFAAVKIGDTNDVEVTGTDSIEKPDVVTQKLSQFDIQAPKFRSFFKAGENQEKVLKKTVTDIYELIKRHYKEVPSNYIVTNVNNKIWYDKEKNKGKYKDDEILGNLEQLFRKHNITSSAGITSNAFFNQQRKNFLKDIENYSKNQEF